MSITIPNETYKSELRSRIEDKNKLTTKGSMYLGTGTTTGVTTPDGTVYVPNTVGFGPVGGDNGRVLIADATTGTGWKIGQVGSAGIASGAVGPNQIASSAVTTAKLGDLITTGSSSYNGQTVSLTQSAGMGFGIGLLGIPEHASQAHNVTTNINGTAISNIFEANGTTVKNATNASKAITRLQSNNGTDIATTAYVRQAISDVKNITSATFVIGGGSVSGVANIYRQVNFVWGNAQVRYTGVYSAWNWFTGGAILGSIPEGFVGATMGPKFGNAAVYRTTGSPRFVKWGLFFIENTGLITLQTPYTSDNAFSGTETCELMFSFGYDI